MEHRWYRRVKTAFAVNLYASDGVELKNCRVNNISMGGIVVDVSENNHVPERWLKNSVIKVEMRVKKFTATLPSLILRNNGQSVALMFIKYHPGLRAFLSWLRSHDENVDVDLKASRLEAYELQPLLVGTKRKIAE